jgi:hypothetical protein
MSHWKQRGIGSRRPAEGLRKARDAEILKRLFERNLADLPVAAVRLPVMDDIAAFPELIERQRIDV